MRKRFNQMFNDPAALCMMFCAMGLISGLGVVAGGVTAYVLSRDRQREGDILWGIAAGGVFGLMIAPLVRAILLSSRCTRDGRFVRDGLFSAPRPVASGDTGYGRAKQGASEITSASPLMAAASPLPGGHARTGSSVSCHRPSPSHQLSPPRLMPGPQALSPRAHVWIDLDGTLLHQKSQTSIRILGGQERWVGFLKECKARNVQVGICTYRFVNELHVIKKFLSTTFGDLMPDIQTKSNLVVGTGGGFKSVPITQAAQMAGITVAQALIVDDQMRVYHDCSKAGISVVSAVAMDGGSEADIKEIFANMHTMIRQLAPLERDESSPSVARSCC
jgi:hypothetical protein